MSLQGSLEGFPLPDVLALLASTKKSGELRVAGQRGAGRVWLSEGAVAGVNCGDATSTVDALFQLLRVDTGSFTFDADADVPDGRSEALESLLGEAQTRLADWRAIEAVVPSLATGVRLAKELPGPKVSVTATQWRAVRAVEHLAQRLQGRHGERPGRPPLERRAARGILPEGLDIVEQTLVDPRHLSH